MQALAREGHAVSYNRAGEVPFDARRLLSADIVHIHRYIGGDAQRTVEQLRARGIGVVWDNDDDLASLPRSNPKYSKYGGPKRGALVRTLQAMATTADIVTTPSEVLAERFRDLGADDVRVIENYVPDAFPGVKQPTHDGVVVAWLAGLEHQTDFQQLRLKTTLERLLEAHPDLRVLSIGLGLGLTKDRYEHIRLVDFLDLPHVLAGADIGIAPLIDIPWNQARSNVKLKEYASAGLPWLASPVGAYRGMGEHQGGRIVDDSDWHQALDALITDARGRKKLAKRATKWVRGQTISKHVSEWEAVYRDAHRLARARLARV